MADPAKQLLAWVNKKLASLVGFDETQELAEYLTTFTALPEVVEFLEPFAGNTAQMRRFAAEYVERKRVVDVRSSLPHCVCSVGCALLLACPHVVLSCIPRGVC